MGIDLVAPYSFIPIYKGLAGKPKNELVVNKKGDAAKNATSPIWWGLLIEARTFFEQASTL